MELLDQLHRMELIAPGEFVWEIVENLRKELIPSSEEQSPRSEEFSKILKTLKWLDENGTLKDKETLTWWVTNAQRYQFQWSEGDCMWVGSRGLEDVCFMFALIFPDVNQYTVTTFDTGESITVNKLGEELQ